jgi:hypothetical protein
MSQRSLRTILACCPLFALTVVSSVDAHPAEELLRIEPNVAGNGDQFGQSIAIADAFLVIGSPGDDDAGSNTGTVTIVWPDPVTGLPASSNLVTPAGINVDAYFGMNVAADGNTFAVSAPHAFNGAMSPVGKVFVFTADSGTGVVTMQASFQPAGLSPSDMYGFDIDLVGDTLVVGAPGRSGNEGSIWVYERTADDWDSGVEFQCPHGEEGNHFGWSVAINHEDESKMIVGAPWDYDAGTDSGRVFYLEKASTVWLNTAEIDQGDLGVTTMNLGSELDYDGDHMAIGEPLNERIHVMGWTSSVPLWGLVDTIAPTTTASTNYFGEAFALEGELLAAGVRFSNLNGAHSGAAYLFRLTDSNEWVQLAELEDSIGAASWAMGRGIAMLGEILLIGSNAAESDSVANAGVALGFDVSSTPGCPSDVVMTGEVDDADVLDLLSSWGPCGGGSCPGDHDDNGMIDVVDLLILVADWGSCG